MPAPQVAAALDSGPADAQALMASTLPRISRVTNGWSMNTDTMGVYGNDYLKRAIVSRIGLGANQPEDAVYPILLADSQGQPVDGDNDYVLHVEADELPPVDAFWSLTMYDARGFQPPTPSTGSPSATATASRPDPMGLDLYVQRTSPGAHKAPNWLPAPAGPLGMTLRLYTPRREALDGYWNPPAIRRIG